MANRMFVAPRGIHAIRDTGWCGGFVLNLELIVSIAATLVFGVLICGAPILAVLIY